MVIVTVLLPLLYLGRSARLSSGHSFGEMPLTSQYSGRNISYWNEKDVYTEALAPGTTGSIQLGVAPGDMAQVTVPACGVPLGAGTLPYVPAGACALPTVPPPVFVGVL